MSSTTTKYDRRAATLDNPQFESLRNPRSRRLLVAALFAIIAAEAVAFQLLPGVNVWLFAGALAVLILLFVFTLGALKASTRGIEELPAEALDERQAQVRGGVFADAYRTLSIIAALVALLFIAMVQNWIALPEPTSITLGVVFFHLIIVIPTVTAALRPQL